MERRNKILDSRSTANISNSKNAIESLEVRHEARTKVRLDSNVETAIGVQQTWSVFAEFQTLQATYYCLVDTLEENCSSSHKGTMKFNIPFDA